MVKHTFHQESGTILFFRVQPSGLFRFRIHLTLDKWTGGTHHKVSYTTQLTPRRTWQ